MENEGWVFSWDDPTRVFAPGGSYCVDVPSTSYCGFRYPGQVQFLTRSRILKMVFLPFFIIIEAKIICKFQRVAGQKVILGISLQVRNSEAY